MPKEGEMLIWLDSLCYNLDTMLPCVHLHAVCLNFMKRDVDFIHGNKRLITTGLLSINLDSFYHPGNFAQLIRLMHILFTY